MSGQPGSALIPTVVQDAATGRVLMLAWSNDESRQRTLEDGRAWFYSRSRERLWLKGETSGNTMELVDVLLDCDGDALLYRVVPAGPACHTGERSCFYRPVASREQQPAVSVDELYGVILERKAALPDGSYTSALFRGGMQAILAKVHEEALEVIDAAADREHLVEELADLTYHILVLMAASGVVPGDVRRALGRRRTSRP